jgi:CRP-like cAMP-binding protein
VNPFDTLRSTPPMARLAACEGCGSRATGNGKPRDAAALEDGVTAARRLMLPARSMPCREGGHAGQVGTIMGGMEKPARLLASGKRQMAGFRCPGNVLGFTNRAAHPFVAVLLTDANRWRLERSQLVDLLKRYPAAVHRLLDPCVQELTATQEQRVAVGHLSAAARVAAFLQRVKRLIAEALGAFAEGALYA